jgi:hypothetical protein
MRARPAAPTSASARPTVVSEAIGPYSSACARNPSTSIMSRAPQPIAQTTSVSTRPRSCTGRKSDLASTADSRSVRPVRSASIRSGTPPAIATTPTPSAETRRSRLHEVKSYT